MLSSSFFSASKDGIEQVYRFFVEALGVQVWDSALAANLRPESALHNIRVSALRVTQAIGPNLDFKSGIVGPFSCQT